MIPHRSQSLKKEAGKILNTDYQKIIARVYYYMVVVALQVVNCADVLLYRALKFGDLRIKKQM